MKSNSIKDTSKKELLEIIDELKIRLRYLENDFRITQYEQEKTTAEYLEILEEYKKAAKHLQWELNVSSSLANLSSKLLTKIDRIEDIAGLVLEHSKSITESEHGFVSRIDPKTGDNVSYAFTRMMKYEYKENVENKCITFAKIPDGYYPKLWGHALNTREGFFTNEPEKHKSSSGIPEGHIIIKKFLSVPIIIGNELVGQIALANSKRDYTELDLKAIKQLRELYALAIHQILSDEDKKKLEEQLFQSQKMESIGRLAGGLAHDFNNILAGIMVYSELLKMKFGDSSTREGKAAYIIYDGAKRAANLTRQLLTFSRKGEHFTIPLNINTAIESAIKISEKIFEKEITIKENFEKDINLIKANENQLNQVFTNLIINAKDAIQKGGKLIFTTKNVYLSKDDIQFIPGITEGKYVKVTVMDTGSGMTPEVKSRIFEPFFTTKNSDKGTGLGLATVYAIIKRHSGHINVWSEPGKGTTFTIYLPVSKKKLVEKKEDMAIVKGAGTILVIDDDVNFRNLAESLLEILGYKAIIAEDGVKALEIYKKKKDKIDMVILDMIMPKMDGAETFEKIKNIDPNIKVIISSGYSEGGKVKKMLSEGAFGYIQKPFAIYELSKIINETLKR